MISITNSALSKIKTILTKEYTSSHYLRLGITASGCSGFSYFLDFQNAPTTEKDQTFNFNDITVVIDSKSLIYLKVCTLDYEHTLMHSGFIFKNPNAQSICGCGNSFDIKF